MAKDEIKLALLKKHMTQQDLAKLLHISTNSLSKKMNGKVSFKLSEAQAIVEHLGVEPSIFFT